MNKHIVSLECENMQEIISTVDVTGLLMDIKFLVNEYYIATFSEAVDALCIALNNGQKFRLTAEEIKS